MEYKQASQVSLSTGETVYRWHVWTNRGRKITWATDIEAARRKAEDKGYEVYVIDPSNGLGAPEVNNVV